MSTITAKTAEQHPINTPTLQWPKLAQRGTGSVNP